MPKKPAPEPTETFTRLVIIDGQDRAVTATSEEDFARVVEQLRNPPSPRPDEQ